MLRDLRRRLTLLSAVLTGVVLVTMALIALSLAEGRIRAGSEAGFQSNVNSIVTKLRTDRVISTSWLAQMEASEDLIISARDGGTPFRFSGSWTPETDRQVLVDRAEAAGRSLGVDVHIPPLSAIDTTSVSFQVEGDRGDRYLAAVVLIPAERGWQSLVILKDLASSDGQTMLLRLAFAVLVLAGVAALLGLCWVFAGRAIRPIEESRRKQAEFIAAASHELRSPLTVIRTSVSALELDPDRAPMLRRNIEGECQRMSRLVEDLLSLARSDAGTWSIQLSPLDLDALLLETAEAFYPVARQKEQSLTLKVPDRDLPLIRGDAQRLRQVLVILLDNAFSYTPRGGRVTLSASADERWVVLRVSDTGPGIPPEQAELIFERFYRADASRSKKEHFGLGLSIARELAALHGGELRVTEPESGGSTFELKLPLVK